MDLAVTTPPVLRSVETELVRMNRRIMNTKEDRLLEFWIKAADAHIERRCNIALMEQTLTLRLTKVLPIVQLPRPRFKEFVSIKYTIKDATEVDVPIAGLTTRLSDQLATLDVPGLTSASDGKMTIVYKAGYSTANDVPPDIAHAVVLLASHWATSREAAFMDPRIMNVEKKIAFGVDQHLYLHKIMNNNSDVNGGY